MTNDERNDMERELARLVSKPMPSGLRGRVLASAREARERAVPAPRLRVVAVACSILLAAVLGADRLVGRHEASRLAALLDGRPTAGAVREGTLDLEELLGGLGSEADMIARLQAMAASAVRKDAGRRFGEARKMLEGWLKNETFENID